LIDSGLEVHSLVGSLPKGLYTDIVNAASDAATVATLRALQSGTLRLPRRTRAPSSHDPSSSGRNEMETGDLQVFKRTWPCVLVDMRCELFPSAASEKEGSSS